MHKELSESAVNQPIVLPATWHLCTERIGASSLSLHCSKVPMSIFVFGLFVCTRGKNKFSYSFPPPFTQVEVSLSSHVMGALFSSDLFRSFASFLSLALSPISVSLYLSRATQLSPSESLYDKLPVACTYFCAQKLMVSLRRAPIATVLMMITTTTPTTVSLHEYMRRVRKE